MKKLNIAIIGQGRSGKDIHGVYYLSERNVYYNVKYVVDYDERRRRISEERYPGCVTFADYRELLDKKDIDLVVNASFSDDHFSVSKDLIEHGFNVLVEKPFGGTYREACTLIELAKAHGVTVAAFQNSQVAPYFEYAKKLIADGTLGDVKQVSIRFNGFSRRWDWQTLQKKCAGGTYNTGPHPVGLALGFLDFDPHTRIAYSKLDTALTSGDGDDYSKIILEAPGKPCVDIEIISCDAYCDYNVKVMGSRGTYKCTISKYECTYIVDGENPEKPVVEHFLEDENGNPLYCSENLVKHTESGSFEGNSFDIGTARIYEDMYYKITENRPLRVTPEMSAAIVNVIESVVAANHLPVKFI